MPSHKQRHTRTANIQPLDRFSCRASAPYTCECGWCIPSRRTRESTSRDEERRLEHDHCPGRTGRDGGVSQSGASQSGAKTTAPPGERRSKSCCPQQTETSRGYLSGAKMQMSHDVSPHGASRSHGGNHSPSDANLMSATMTNHGGRRQAQSGNRRSENPGEPSWSHGACRRDENVTSGGVVD